MDPNASPDQPSNDCDDVALLKQKLADAEDKLVKFKRFVVNLRNERTELQEKLSESNSNSEKLKTELSKFQAKSYQQIFQNFQNLQIEYDKIQDEIDIFKKTNKSLENDLNKCMQELGSSREMCANQQEEIDQLKFQSSQQQLQINNLTNTNRDFESKIIVLQTEYKNEKKKSNDFQLCERELNSTKEELNRKNIEIVELREKLEQSMQRVRTLEDEIVEKDSLSNRCEELEATNQQLTIENEKYHKTQQSQKEEIDNYVKEIEELRVQKEQTEKKIVDSQFDHVQKIASLELTISELQNKLKLTEEDLTISSSKFEEYKQRVSNVLKENKLNNFDYSKNIEDLNFKIEKLQDENSTFRTKCDNLLKEIEKLKAENETFKYNHQSNQSELKNFEELKTKFNQLSNENFKLTNIVEQLKVSSSKEKQSILEEHSDEIEKLKMKYENKIRELEDEMVNFRIAASDDSNSIGNSNASFEEIKEENISFPSSNASHSERNFLEEILNYDTSSKSSDVPHSSNIDNLTQLLSESENSIALLSEQNRLLKDELRRVQRSVERMDIANNLEYLKNVLMKFLTIKGVDERERLITVLTTILKLTPEERDLFHQCAQDNSGSQLNSKWSLFQWS